MNNDSKSKLPYGTIFINMVTDTELVSTKVIYAEVGDKIKLSNGKDYTIERIVSEDTVWVMPAN